MSLVYSYRGRTMDGCTTRGLNLQSRNPVGGVSRTVDLTPWRQIFLLISKLASVYDRRPMTVEWHVCCFLMHRANTLDAHTPVQRG